MREIIFRGKRVDNGEWVFGFLFKNHCRAWILLPDEFVAMGFEWIEVIPETVGQYTGLKDKNGKMIFEGDLVHNPNDANFCYEIVWHNEGAGFSLGRDASLYLKQYCFHEFWEIIGNIHEGEKS